MISCTFVTCFIVNCETIFKKRGLLEISLATTCSLFFSLAPGKILIRSCSSHFLLALAFASGYGTSAIDCLERLGFRNDLLYVEWYVKPYSLTH